MTGIHISGVNSKAIGRCECLGFEIGHYNILVVNHPWIFLSESFFKVNITCLLLVLEYQSQSLCLKVFSNSIIIDDILTLRIPKVHIVHSENSRS